MLCGVAAARQGPEGPITPRQRNQTTRPEHATAPATVQHAKRRSAEPSKSPAPVAVNPEAARASKSLFEEIDSGAAAVVLLLAAFWSIPAMIVARYAERKGKSYAGWFIFSFLLSPLLGALLVWATGTDEQGLVKSGRYARCLSCRELVRAGATRCRHCHADPYAPAERATIIGTR